jgi:hypothetical protein
VVAVAVVLVQQQVPLVVLVSLAAVEVERSLLQVVLVVLEYLLVVLEQLMLVAVVVDMPQSAATQ